MLEKQEPSNPTIVALTIQIKNLEKKISGETRSKSNYTGGGTLSVTNPCSGN